MLNACAYHKAFQWKMSNQLNTQWVSEDGTIAFNVNGEHVITGTMKVHDEVIDIYIEVEPEASSGIHIYPIDALEDEIISTDDEYEKWICSYKSESNFVAMVKETTFYEVGQEITFYRIEYDEHQSADFTILPDV